MKGEKFFAVLLCSSLVLCMSSLVTFADEIGQKGLGESEREAIVYEIQDDMQESVSNDSMNAVKLLGASSGSSMESATYINLSQNYSGTISENQDKYFYRFSIASSGRIALQATAYMRWIYYGIYDSDGNLLWSVNPSWNSTTETISTSEKIDLTEGTYYFVAEKDGRSRTGNYTFTLNFESANESFAESGNGSNNSISSGKTIKTNTVYYGQIAINDEKDFYRFDMTSSGRITLMATAQFQRVYYRLYDVDGNQLWSRNPSWNSEVGKSSVSEGIDLSKGTYYFAVERDGNRTGRYSFQIIVPKKQPMTVKTKTVTVKKSSLKKAKKSIKKSKVFTISNAKGTVSFAKISGSKKITISPKGKITIKKGTKKGTYKIKVMVFAAGNDQYKPGSKTVTVKIKVK